MLLNCLDVQVNMQMLIATCDKSSLRKRGHPEVRTISLHTSIRGATPQAPKQVKAPLWEPARQQGTAGTKEHCRPLNTCTIQTMATLQLS